MNLLRSTLGRLFTLLIVAAAGAALPPPAQADQAPVIDGSGIISAREAEYFRYFFSAAGEKNVTWTVDGLPPPLLYDSAPSISGVPAEPGYFVLTVTAANAHGSSSRDFLLAVRPTGWKILHRASWGGTGPIAVGRPELLSALSSIAWSRSEDGREWEEHFDISDPNFPIFSDLAWGAGTYAGVTGSGEVFTSPDGRAWSRRDSRAGCFYGVGYGGGLFVAVGAPGLIATSPDGITWTTQSSGVSGDLYHVAYGDGKFVAVGRDSLLLVSEDGASWSQQPVAYQRTIRRVVWGNGMFVAVGDGLARFKYSEELGWDSYATRISAEHVVAVAFGDGQFLAVTESGSSFQSTNGTDWITLGSSTNGRVNGAAFAHGRFVVTTAEGAFLTPGAADTPSMATPAARSILEGQPVEIAVEATGEATGFVALNLPPGLTQDPVSGVISGSPAASGIYSIILGAYSNDGPAAPVTMEVAVYPHDATPPIVRLPDPPILVSHRESIWQALQVEDALGNAVVEVLDLPESLWFSPISNVLYGTLPAGSYSIRLHVSNGIAATEMVIPIEVFPSIWEPIDLGTTANILTSVAEMDLLLLAGTEGTILTSGDDGESWQKRDAGTTEALRGAAYGAGLFVLVGDSGLILTSNDGVSWQPRESGTANRLSDIAFGSHGFIAHGPSGTVLRSRDGISWSPLAVDPALGIGAITYAHGRYVAGLQFGRTAHSEDGENWHVSPRFVNGLSDIQATADGFVASAYGRIFHSPQGSEWRTVARPPPGTYRLASAGTLTLAAGLQPTAMHAEGKDWAIIKAQLPHFSIDTAMAAPDRFLIAGSKGHAYAMRLPPGTSTCLAILHRRAPGRTLRGEARSARHPHSYQSHSPAPGSLF